VRVRVCVFFQTAAVESDGSDGVKACVICVDMSKSESELKRQFYKNCQRSLYFCGNCYLKASQKLKERDFCGLCESCDFGNNKVNIAVVFVFAV